MARARILRTFLLVQRRALLKRGFARLQEDYAAALRGARCLRVLEWDNAMKYYHRKVLRDGDIDGSE